MNSSASKLRHFLLLGTLSLTTLCGCTVGPNYKRPDVNTPGNFRNAPTTVEANSLAELAWWDIYKDETLKGLIRTALVNNYDYRIAATRVEQSRAIAIQVNSQFYPQIGYEGEAFRGKNSFLGNPVPTGGGKTQNSFAGFLNAAWEIDMWGRIRRLDESAWAEFLASEESRRGIKISLISDVATAYFELLELEKELEIARRTVKSFDESLQIFTERFNDGIASKLETSRAQAALSATAAVVPNLESLIAVKENQINVLLGRNPEPVARHSTLPEQTTPVEVPAGLPSALLERRPDIRQAEQLVRSANAQVGVAIGDFLPRIGLTAIYGGVSTDLSTIIRERQRVWSVGANVSGPIFQGGRLKGQYLQVVSAWEEVKLRYQQTALNAFKEVADTLILREKLVQIRIEQVQSVQAYEEAVKVSTERYIAGKANYYEVLETQQQLFPAENALAQTQLNQLLVIVQLYKALGGGWEAEQIKTQK